MKNTLLNPLRRLVRHLFRCRHRHWSTTATNGFYLPIEERCDKCGVYRHRRLSARKMGRITPKWQDGLHPGSIPIPLPKDPDAATPEQNSPMNCPLCNGHTKRLFLTTRCMDCDWKISNIPPSTALSAVLGDAQSAQLTAEKTEAIQKRGEHRITGFVLCHPDTGERCIVEMSAVRWLSNEESWWLMHESKSPIHSTTNNQANP